MISMSSTASACARTDAPSHEPKRAGVQLQRSFGQNISLVYNFRRILAWLRLLLAWIVYTFSAVKHLRFPELALSHERQHNHLTLDPGLRPCYSLENLSRGRVGWPMESLKTEAERTC
jgi:hypothetical protein